MKSDYKEAVKAVRGERKWKKATKAMLIEAGKRYFERDMNQRQIRKMLGGILGVREADGLHKQER